MKLSTFSINNYRFTTIVVILLMISGIISLIRMPKAEDPPVSKPGVSVVVIYPGATPSDMEQLVVVHIEEALNELDDIKKIESNCRDALATIRIEFNAGGDPDEKYSQVNEKVNSIREELPANLLSLDTIKWSVADTNFLQIALVSEKSSYRELEKQAQRLEKTLKKIKGIKRTETGAFPRQEVRVSLDLEKMAELNIPLKKVIGSIQSANMNIPGGNIDAGTRRFAIKTSGPYDSLEQIKRTVIHSEGTKVLYLKDLAEVFPAYEDGLYVARYNGQRCVWVTATQKEGSNIFNIMKDIETGISKYSAELPGNIQIEYVHNQSESVNHRLTGFFSNLVLGVILLGIIVFLAIDWRGSVIVMVVIPISILVGISLLDKSGYGLQQMSIVGLVITLGLLVDNAIVIVESIDRFIKKGQSNHQASINGSAEVGWPVVSGAATTILAFVPIVMMGGISGDFIRSMPLTVIYTLAASLFIALTFTPFLSGKILPTTRKRKEGKLLKYFNGFIQGHYRKLLHNALDKPIIVIAAVVVFLLISLALFPIIGVSFFPKAEKKQFFINVNLPEGSSIDETDRVVADVEKYLKTNQWTDYYIANIGKTNPRIYYNIIEKPPQSNLGQVYVKLKEDTNRDQMKQLLQNLRSFSSGYPGARIEVKELMQGPPVNAPVEITIRGEKAGKLKKIAGDIEKTCRETPGLVNIHSPFSTIKTDIQVNVNRDKAAMMGIPLAEIDLAVRLSVAGIAVSDYMDRDGKTYDIVVRSKFKKKTRLNIFDKIYLTTATGSSIPLKQVATINLKPGSSRVSHFNLDRSATITADVLDGYSVNQVTGELIAALENYPWPAGYDYFSGGEKESREESFGDMIEAIVIAIIAIFAILVLQFRSFTQPLIVFSALPMAITGSVLALLISGYTFSFTAFIGFTSLVGIVVNDSILLVDCANQLRKKENKTITSAIKEAGEIRFLPIVITSMTTIGGLLPLTLRGGTLWAPLGWVIIGGLFTSTALTLIVVPTLYKMFSKK